MIKDGKLCGGLSHWAVLTHHQREGSGPSCSAADTVSELCLEGGRKQTKLRLCSGSNCDKRSGSPAGLSIRREEEEEEEEEASYGRIRGGSFSC